MTVDHESGYFLSGGLQPRVRASEHARFREDLELPLAARGADRALCSMRLISQSRSRRPCDRVATITQQRE